MVRAVGVTPANAAASSVTNALAHDLESQNVVLAELHIARAYLTSHWVKERSSDLTIIGSTEPSM
jgi:hypothetical protein